MADLVILPALELVDGDSPFDEAVIMIDGREEDTITVACEGSRELAEKLVRLVNATRRALVLPPQDEVQTPYNAGASS